MVWLQLFEYALFTQLYEFIFISKQVDSGKGFIKVGWSVIIFSEYLCISVIFVHIPQIMKIYFLPF